MVPSRERTEVLREEINRITAHALIRQSEAIINRMDNIVVKTVRAALAGEPLHITGPELNGHIGEARFYSRPINPINIEVQGDNVAEFVMHPPRDNIPLEPQVYSTAPLVIPQGYWCQLRYRQLEDGEARPPPYPNGVLVNERRKHQPSAPEARPPQHPVKSADQEMLDWQHMYNTGPIQHDPAAQSSGVNLDAQVAEIMRNQYGIVPKRGAIAYAKPYPEVYDLLEAPPKFKTLDFTKFSGNDSASTIEHVSRYLAQLGPASQAEHMKIRLFSLSVTGPAFGWYTTLAPGSITNWKQMEEKFHA